MPRRVPSPEKYVSRERSGMRESMLQVRIFLHEPGKFVYFVGLDEMPDNRKIDQLKLR